MSRYITDLNIETYRGINNLAVSDLGSINILVGDNNSGKTSVLEAIQILCDPSKYNMIQVARQREKYKFSSRMGLSTLDLFMYMFNISTEMKNKNQYKIAMDAVVNGSNEFIKISGEMIDQLIDLKEVAEYNFIARNKINQGLVEEREEVKTFIGEIISSYPRQRQESLFGNKQGDHFEINEYTRISRSARSNPIIEVRNIQTIDHIVENAFNQIIKNKNIKEKTIQLLKSFDKTISDLRYINDNNRFVPVIESNLPEYLPLSMYGDGMKKAITMLNALISAENGIVLIDEFETALHTSVMEKVFKFIFYASQQLNVQLFLTTHSIEAVDKLLASADKKIDDIRVITLKRDTMTGQTLVRNLKGSEVAEDRKNFDFEVR